MKRRYPAGMFCLFVLFNFFLHFFYLSIPGILLCIAGIWNKVCLLIGAGVLLLDLLLSIIEQMKIAAAATSESDNPEFNELMDAFCTGGLQAFGEVVDAKMQAQNTPASPNAEHENKETTMDIQAFQTQITETVVNLMLSYRAEFDEDEAPFSEDDVRTCETLLVAYVTVLAAMPNPTDTAIMAEVKNVVLALNDLSEKTDYGMIETMEREAICEIIQAAALAAGLSTLPEDDDVTGEWREW